MLFLKKVNSMAFFKGRLSPVRFIFGIVVVLIIAALTWGGIWYYKRLKDPVIPASEALPPHPLYVIQVKNVLEFWDNFSKTSSIWKALTGIQWFGELNTTIRNLDSTLNQHPDIVVIMGSGPLIIAGYYTGKSVSDPLFLMNLSGPHHDDDIDDLIKELAGKKAQITTTKQGEYMITSVSENATGSGFHYSVPCGIFIAGKSKQLVSDALTTLEKGTSAMKNPTFVKLGSMAGKNSEANIFLNTAALPKLLESFRSDSLKEDLEFLTRFGDWAELDVKTRKCEWMLSGYLNAGGDEHSFLGSFSRQTPGRSSLDHSLPFNSGIVLKFRFDDFDTFYHDYVPRFASVSADSLTDAAERQHNLNIRDNFFDWISDEMALVVTVTGANNIADNTFAVFRTVNPDKALKALSAIQLFENETMPGNDGNRDETGCINARGLIPQLFGGLFAGIKNTCYIRINDLIVFGNSPGALRNFRASVLSGKSLERNNNYTAFKSNLGERSNLSLYVNIRNGFNILKSFASRELKASMQKNISVFRNFEAIGLQISAEKEGLFYTSLYLKFNPLYDDENPAIWETPLDTALYCSPSVITDQRDSSTKIVAFDVSGTVYLLDDMGQLIWKKRLKVKPVSEAWPVENKKENNGCIAFCTAEKLWMLDMNGKTLAPYPVKLPVNAAGPVSLFDPDNKKQYVLIYPGTNKKMNCITITGTINKQWAVVPLKGTVTEKVVRFKNGSRENFVFSDNNGNLYFTDRNGKINLTIKQAFKQAKHSGVYAETRNNGAFITTDEKGHVAEISLNGSVTFTNTGNFTAGHYFLYEDFNLDGINDYIYFDKNAVVVYNRDKKVLYKRDLAGDIMNVKPAYLRFDNGCLLAAVAPENDHLILFNASGIYDELRKYTATLSPVVATFYKGDRPLLIGVSGKFIRCYETCPE